MAKMEKPIDAEATSRKGTILSIRCDPEDLVMFKDAGIEEGFNGRTAWMLYHLRKQAKKTLREKDPK